MRMIWVAKTLLPVMVGKLRRDKRAGGGERKNPEPYQGRDRGPEGVRRRVGAFERREKVRDKNGGPGRIRTCDNTVMSGAF